MAMRDYVKPGQRYSADYLRFTDLDGSRSFDQLFKLTRCRGAEATKAGAITMLTEFGKPDNSPIYRVNSKNPCIEIGWWEFTSNQTGTILIPSQGADTSIVVTYAAIRTESTTGQAYFHDDLGNKALQNYFSNFSASSAGGVYVRLAAGQPVRFTSTQGAKKIYASLNYYLLTVEA